MATTPRRSRTAKANLWEFLLVLSGNRTIVRWLGFLIVSVVLVVVLVLVLRIPVTIADVTIWPQVSEPTSAAAPTAAPADTALPAALPTAAAPASTSTTPEIAGAPTAVVVDGPAPTALSDCPRPVGALSKNAELIGCAWSFWNEGLYEQVIAVADKCIFTFEGQALREQQALSASGQPAPLIGQPGDRAELNEILKRGVLNDVAACHFVRGQALERLGRLDEAADAYGSVQRYPHARVWDPAGDLASLGFFWSPALAASDRLALLP